MTPQQRIECFIQLGERLKTLPDDTKGNWLQLAQSQNGWFTGDSVQSALEGIIRYLEEQDLHQWLKNYSFDIIAPKRVGAVMAGNIPGVGFHDMLCVLLSGHILYAKLSSQDSFLIKKLAELLFEIEPAFQKQLVFAERLNEMDAIIATGSDNSARYFHYYFGKKPHIIRQNRTSCGILRGNETAEELKALGGDILQYFGLGCRNVSKLFVPQGYSFDLFFESIQALSPVINHHKYSNNYDYNKSIYLVNQVSHLDNGFLLLMENEAAVSPVSVVYYEFYQDKHTLEEKIGRLSDKLQCVVSHKGWFPGSIPFGEAQRPRVWDYADQVDTMQFLLSL